MSDPCSICAPTGRRCPAVRVKFWPCCGAPLEAAHRASCRTASLFVAIARMSRPGFATGREVLVARDGGEVMHTVARSAPWQLGDGTPVILLSGITGGFSLARVVGCRRARGADKGAAQGELWPGGEADSNDGRRKRFRRRAWEQLGGAGRRRRRAGRGTHEQIASRNEEPPRCGNTRGRGRN
ncbi:hypothetical protein [Chondromyces apiculatus]|nr:hypothetical protein [Chondromyces apiculatus]